MSNQKLQKLQNEDAPILRMVLAGLASVCAGGSTHPVDTIKIRLQKEGEGGTNAKVYNNIWNGGKVIIKNEGFTALYKGLGPALLREASYSTLRLGLYEPFKDLLGAKQGQKTPLWIMFTAGVLSGSSGALVANPFDLLKVRLQSMQGKERLGVLLEVKTILKAEGLLGLYKGLSPNIFRGAILTGTKMATYDKTKQSLIRYLNFREGLSLYFTCSFITGLMLSLTTSPMDLMKTLMMSQKAGKQEYKGLIDCGIRTFRQEGLGAFYKGFIPQWIRFGPFNVIQLIVWEELRTLCGLRNI